MHKLFKVSFGSTKSFQALAKYWQLPSQLEPWGALWAGWAEALTLVGFDMRPHSWGPAVAPPADAGEGQGATCRSRSSCRRQAQHAGPSHPVPKCRRVPKRRLPLLGAGVPLSAGEICAPLEPQSRHQLIQAETLGKPVSVNHNKQTHRSLS